MVTVFSHSYHIHIKLMNHYELRHDGNQRDSQKYMIIYYRLTLTDSGNGGNRYVYVNTLIIKVSS